MPTQVAVSTGQGRPDLTGLAAAQAAQTAVDEWKRELQSLGRVHTKDFQIENAPFFEDKARSIRVPQIRRTPLEILV